MHQDEMSRRDFHRLSTAAFGGLLAGVTVGCTEEASKPGTKPVRNESPSPAAKSSAASSEKTSESKPTDAGGANGPAVAATAVALHACRGLNACKEEGKDHKNACVGQGSCYTTKHECAGQNDCKYQGGCGGEHGLNDCKGKGGCGHLPITGNAWKKARDAFEARMAKAGKKVGKAPEPAKS